jgi:hypothetical protein
MQLVSGSAVCDLQWLGLVCVKTGMLQGLMANSRMIGAHLNDPRMQLVRGSAFCQSTLQSVIMDYV